MAILDQYGKPVTTSRRMSHASSDAGARRGAMGGWLGPQVYGENDDVRERMTMQRRAADLADNDWAAESILSSITQNAVGVGLKPRAQIPFEELGISQEQALKLGRRMEWLWWKWSTHADVRGQQTFEQLQFLGLRTMLIYGEMLHIPVMLPESEREYRGLSFSLSIQDVTPTRLRTPASMEADDAVKDGIRMNAWGRPVAYYIASPESMGKAHLRDGDGTAPYSTIPAMRAGRPGVFHLFPHKDSEQVRGRSILATSIGLFRTLNDAISFELLAQNMAAEFPVFIEKDNSMNIMGQLPQGVEQDDDGNYYTDLRGPQIMYGNAGEKPQVLTNERPSANFQSFVKLVQKAMSASVGGSYIAMMKDFEGANYSVARAAMNEAWRLYRWYREFFAMSYCQPVWEAVMEEAWLRDYFTLPAGAPDFYEAKDLWTACAWNGPARGYMDPTKEVQAELMAIEGFLKTRHQSMAENGGDFDEEYPVMVEESKKMKALSGDSAGNRPVIEQEEDDEQSSE